MRVQPIRASHAPAFPRLGHLAAACAIASLAAASAEPAADAKPVPLAGRIALPPKAEAMPRPAPQAAEPAMISTKALQSALGVPVKRSPISTSPAWLIGSGANQWTVRPGDPVAIAGRRRLQLSVAPVATKDGLLLPAAETGRALGLRVSVRGNKLQLLNASTRRALVLEQHVQEPSKPPADPPIPLQGTPAAPKLEPLQGDIAPPPAPGK